MPGWPRLVSGSKTHVLAMSVVEWDGADEDNGGLP
jgi:hypothetical protein